MGLGAAVLSFLGAPGPTVPGEVIRSSRISGAGTPITAGAVRSLDPVHQLRGPLWYGSPSRLGQAGEMLRDPHVRQSVGYRSAPLCAATWRFRPASDSPLDREVADFCKWAFLERLPWVTALKAIGASYNAYGFALREMTDDYAPVPTGRFPTHPGGGRGIVPTGLHEVPAWTVSKWRARTDDPSKLDSIVQFIPQSDSETLGYRPVPADRLLRWTFDQEGGNFEGFALLRSAWAAWKMRKAFLVIQAIKHERRGVGVPVAIEGEMPSDQEIDAAEEALAEMRANERGYIVLPHGWTFKWEGGSTSDGTNIEAAIAACNIDIAVNASAGFMMLGSQTASGSYALGATQQGHFHITIVGDAAFVAIGFNLGYDGWSPVERVVRLNYGPDVGLPQLEARNLPTLNQSERIPLLINATNVGLVTPEPGGPLENSVREALEFDPYDPDTARPRGAGTVELMPTARDRQAPPPAPADSDKAPPPAPPRDEEDDEQDSR